MNFYYNTFVLFQLNVLYLQYNYLTLKIRIMSEGRVLHVTKIPVELFEELWILKLKSKDKTWIGVLEEMKNALNREREAIKAAHEKANKEIPGNYDFNNKLDD